jgi:hypothetical protein
MRITKLLATAAAIAITASAGSPALAQNAPIATSYFATDPDLHCDLLQAKRISGGAVMITWRLINSAAPPTASLSGTTTAKRIYYNMGAGDHEGGFYFVDPAENKKYFILTDSANHMIAGIPGTMNLDPGQQSMRWAKLPAPPATSSKISISVPGCAPPFEDVPLSQ